MWRVYWIWTSKWGLGVVLYFLRGLWRQGIFAAYEIRPVWSCS